MTIKLYGSLADANVKEGLERAQQKPEEWTVYVIEARGKTRTPAQNRLFQVLIRKLAQQQGRSVQYWYDFLVERFLGFEEVETEDGYRRQVLCSTSDLSVVEFTEFLNACLSFAAENQVH